MACNVFANRIHALSLSYDAAFAQQVTAFIIFLLPAIKIGEGILNRVANPELKVSAISMSRCRQQFYKHVVATFLLKPEVFFIRFASKENE
jgi:hypothetical protein